MRTTLLGILLALPVVSFADTVHGETGKKLDEYLGRLEKFGFSGVVLVVRGDEILLERGYGLANRDRQIPFTPLTVHSVGSITKQFTAAAILKLEMQGKLSVRDSISRYLPGVPPDKRGITLHHLLTHSAGLRGDFGGRDSDPVRRDDFVKLVLREPLEAAPGERYEYSNEGYSLLGAIIEVVSAMSYEGYLRQNLFEPVGMKETGYVLPKWSSDRIAHGYTGEGDWGTITEKGWGEDGPGWYLKANGGIHTTARDMYRWHRALEGEAVLSASAKARMFTPYIVEGPGALSYYGYGWAIFQSPRKTRLIAHNGGNGVFAADFQRYVDEGVMIYAASNSAISAIDLTEVLSAIVFGGRFDMPPAVTSLPEAEIARLAGKYHTESDEEIVVRSAGGRLTVESSEGAVFALLAGLAAAGTPRFAAAEARTRELIEESSRGNFSAVHRAFGGRLPLKEVIQAESDFWKQRTERLGRLTGTDVIGSSRGGPGVQVTARLRHERGSSFVRYGWDGDSLAGIRTLPVLPAATFLPASREEFYSFSLRPPTSLHLRISAGRLTVSSNDATLSATR